MPPQARLGDQSQVPSDGHGCLCCDHSCIGPATKGSPDVFVNGRPAIRVGDQGVHSSCCGANTWQCIAGSSTVMINNMPAHRLGDQNQHCGGMGKMVEGSPNVTTGG